MIQITDLVKTYGSKKALSGIDLEVKKGEIMGLLGPNGAGKSTTMNIMTGYLSASSGQVLIHGHDILTEPLKAKRSIGYLPEIPPLYPDMKVKEYLDFAAKLKKIKKEQREQQIEHVMELTQIKEYQNRLIRFLSKGYKQRVGLAQALLGDPELLILDEPTVGLDPNQMIKMRKLIKDLAQDHTIILSSHILSEISAVCDSVVIIDKGKVIARGKTKELEEQFSNKEILYLTLKGEKETLEHAAEACMYFDSYQLEMLNDEEGKIRAELKEEGDIRDQLFFYFAEKKVAILNMEQETKSLEEVFLCLTEEKEEANI